MKNSTMYRNTLLIVCLLSVSFMYSHGNLSKRIKEKTVEIKKHPKNASLYFERGFLYEQHEELNKAIEDYLKSERLGYTNILLQFRKAQTYYNNNKFSKALTASRLYLEKDSVDVKINKLHAQILIQLFDYDRALKHYQYFIENTIDINPGDVIEYSNIYLVIDNINYEKALDVIESGLNKLGKDTFSLQQKKLEYLKASLQINNAIEQYNYFIISTDRKEFWYYKKAKYLIEQEKYDDAKISIQQAKAAIVLLNDKFKNTGAIKNLIDKIKNIEKHL